MNHFCGLPHKKKNLILTTYIYISTHWVYCFMASCEMWQVKPFFWAHHYCWLQWPARETIISNGKVHMSHYWLLSSCFLLFLCCLVLLVTDYRDVEETSSLIQIWRNTVTRIFKKNVWNAPHNSLLQWEAPNTFYIFLHHFFTMTMQITATFTSSLITLTSLVATSEWLMFMYSYWPVFLVTILWLPQTTKSAHVNPA